MDFDTGLSVFSGGETISEMKIALAQVQPVKGNINENIAQHLRFINAAIDNNANAIFFPELSLTCYEPSLAEALATAIDDNRLSVFQPVSDENNIVVGLGVPTKSAAGIRISMIVFQPNMPREIYSKQHLHEDELPYFVPGNEQKYVTIENTKIALAICYESLLLHHAESASREGMDVYLASVAKSANGVAKAYRHYPKIAADYSIPVLMTNSTGYCDNFQSTGSSAAWNSDGSLSGKLDENNEGILIYDTETGKSATVFTKVSVA